MGKLRYEALQRVVTVLLSGMAVVIEDHAAHHGLGHCHTHCYGHSYVYCHVYSHGHGHCKKL